MKFRFWSLFLVLGLTSCNLATTQSTSTPLPQPKPGTPTLNLSTFTPVPTQTPLRVFTSTPTIELTSTPIFILASPKDQPVNCRYGPDVSYAITGALHSGAKAEMIGRNEDSSWWYVKNPNDPSTVCWLSAEFIVTTGNVASLPVVGPPQIGVINIHVTVDPILMNVNCAAFPQYVSASADVTTNGPAIVTWRWETNAENTSKEETLLFETAGTKTVQGYFTVKGANDDYWVNLHTLLPNDRSRGTNFRVTCVP